MSDQTGRVALTTPITRRYRQPDGVEREEQVTELVVRKPFARDLRATDKHEGEVAKGIALAAHLTGVSIADIDGLELADFQAVMAKVEVFTGSGPATGPNPASTRRLPQFRLLRPQSPPPLPGAKPSRKKAAGLTSCRSFRIRRVLQSG